MPAATAGHTAPRLALCLLREQGGRWRRCWRPTEVRSPAAGAISSAGPDALATCSPLTAHLAKGRTNPAHGAGFVAGHRLGVPHREDSRQSPETRPAAPAPGRGAG